MSKTLAQYLVELRRNNKLREVSYLEKNPTGEGFMRPFGFTWWVRVYREHKAIATFQISEFPKGNKETGELVGDLMSLSMAVPRRGLPPVPWERRNLVWLSQEPNPPVNGKKYTTAWWEQDILRLYESLSTEQKSALHSYYAAKDGFLSDSVEVEEEAIEKCRALFPGFTLEKLDELSMFQQQYRDISLRLTVNRLHDKAQPSQKSGVRGGAIVYPVPTPDGLATWQFPGFKIGSHELAQILYKFRRAGQQRLTIEQLLQARDYYRKTQ